jgi:hypothetical protein
LAKALSDRAGSVLFQELEAGPDYYVVARSPGFSDNFLLVKCQNPPGPPTEIGLNRPIDVSLVQLIANPAAWHDHVVRIIGYLDLEFEGTALYLHKDDCTHGVSKNAIWVDFSLAELAQYDALHRRYVIIEGVFDATSYGHMSLFSGTLTKITRCERWR